MSYNTLVQLMNDWNWLLSGLSAGAFAIIFNWLINRKKSDNYQQSLIKLVLLELFFNCTKMNQYLEAHFHGHPKSESFVRRRDWEIAYHLLAQVLPSDSSIKIELAYQAYAEMENILCQSHIDDISELHYRYRTTVILTQDAFKYLNEKIDDKIDPPKPYNFDQH